MKITQKQNRELTELFCNNRKYFIVIVSILLIMIIVSVLAILNSLNNKYSPMIYDSPERVRNIVEDNEEDFNTVMDVIYQNPAFDKIFEKSIKFSVSDYRKFKKYMPEKDYIILEHFCLKYKPAFLRKDSIIFNTKGHSVEIFSCKDMTQEEIRENLAYKKQNGFVEKIYGDLYFFEFTD